MILQLLVVDKPCLKDHILDQILLKTEDDLFVMGRDFTRFKFKSDDDLPCNIKINVPVCVISIDNVFEQGWYYPQIILRECFHENSEYY